MPRITIITCPVLIFAANRKERVRGRTVELMVSMIIRKGHSHPGAPAGIKPLKNPKELWLADDI